jgi:phenylacetate-CoA ligase
VQDSQQGTDEVVVKVGLNAEVVEENMRFKNHPEEIVNELKNRFRAHVRVGPTVVISSVDEVQRINFPRCARKPVKFVDLRS